MANYEMGWKTLRNMGIMNSPSPWSSGKVFKEETRLEEYASPRLWLRLVGEAVAVNGWWQSLLQLCGPELVPRTLPASELAYVWCSTTSLSCSTGSHSLGYLWARAGEHGATYLGASDQIWQTGSYPLGCNMPALVLRNLALGCRRIFPKAQHPWISCTVLSATL